MKRYDRIKKQYIAEFHAGEYRAGRIHVSSSVRDIVAACLSSIAPQHRRNPAMREARKAYYLGAINALMEERKLMGYFRL